MHTNPRTQKHSNGFPSSSCQTDYSLLTTLNKNVHWKFQGEYVCIILHSLTHCITPLPPIQQGNFLCVYQVFLSSRMHSFVILYPRDAAWFFSSQIHLIKFSLCALKRITVFCFFINNILNILLYSLAHAEYWESDEANVCLLLVVLFAMDLLLVYWELFSAMQRLVFRGVYILCHWPLKLHFVLHSVFCDFCRWCVAVCLSFCLYGSVNADSVTSTSAMLWRLLLLLRMVMMVMMTLTMLIMFMKFKSILNSILYRGFQIMFFSIGSFIFH